MLSYEFCLQYFRYNQSRFLKSFDQCVVASESDDSDLCVGFATEHVNSSVA